jgi:hypothetical protein
LSIFCYIRGTMAEDSAGHPPDAAPTASRNAAGAPRPRSTAGAGALRLAVLALAALAAAGCTTDVDLGGGVRQQGDHIFTYESPELEAALSTRQAESSLGDEWLVLAVELRSTSRSGPVTVSRSDVSVRTPDGRRLALVDQDTYRTNYGRVRVAVELAVAALPTLGRFDTAQMPCDRWFLTDPFSGFAYDDVSVNTFQTCRGPLVFFDSGGIQPGRWRLLIDLEESTADIPFDVEAPE